MIRLFPGADIYAITDDGLSLGRPVLEVAEQLLKGGVRLIQYREKDKSAAHMLDDCLRLRALTKEAGAGFIVNDHVDIAMICKADGVHVGQDDLPVPAVRGLLKAAGLSMLVGVSTHAPEQAAQAVKDGADCIGVGPIFATQTKKDVVDPVGLEYLEYVVKNYPALPFAAIGGIKIHNVGEVAQRGAKSVCMISEIVGCEDIPAQVERARRAMHGQ